MTTRIELSQDRAVASGDGTVYKFEASTVTIRERFVELVAIPEEDGGFSAYVPALPGVHSQGEDAIEAFESVEEALRGAIATYEEAGEDVPWLKEYPEESNAKHRSKWIGCDA